MELNLNERKLEQNHLKCSDGGTTNKINVYNDKMPWLPIYLQAISMASRV